MIDISLEQFQEAANFLRQIGLETPLIKLPLTKSFHGQTIYMKAENLQPSGSFKIRGASFAISRLTPQQRTKGVIAFSTGNHAQAVAYAAQKENIKATIVMPSNVAKHKLEATKRYGATIVLSEPTSEAARTLAESIASEKQMIYLSPYDHPHMITGQGTIGIELLKQLKEFGAVFVPIGGGGLISGIAMAIKKTHPEIKMIGVVPELEPHAADSFRFKEHRKDKGPSSTIADAIRIQTLGALTYPLVLKYVDDVITVNESQIARATLIYAEEGHLIVEPGGALGLAGALCYPKVSERAVICIACGGNTTISFLEQIRMSTNPSVS